MSDTQKAPPLDTKLEIVVIPVSDIDRAKRFYGDLGWRLDAEFASGDDFRIMQFTPPGSGCSVIFGKNVTAAAPGSAQGMYLIVSDIVAARSELLGRGVESTVFQTRRVRGHRRLICLVGRVSGRIEKRSYRSFASFSRTAMAGCPEVTRDYQGASTERHDFHPSSTGLAAALRRASAAHGEHEKRNGGKHDENWPDWYAAYMVAEQAGKELPS